MNGTSIANTSKWLVLIRDNPAAIPLIGPRRLRVRNKFDSRRTPRRIEPRGNENFFRLKLSQKFELMFPKRPIAKKHRRLVPAHAKRFPTGQQNRAKIHATTAGIFAVERRI